MGRIRLLYLLLYQLGAHLYPYKITRKFKLQILFLFSIRKKYDNRNTKWFINLLIDLYIFQIHFFLNLYLIVKKYHQHNSRKSFLSQHAWVYILDTCKQQL